MNAPVALNWVPEQIPDVPSVKLPPIISGDAFLHQNLVLPDELVAGLIHRGTLSEFAGGSKSFKTWILLNLGVSVASGEDFWQRETKQGRVLYLNFEIDAAFFQKRLREVSRLITGDDKTIKSFDVWNLRGHCADIAKLAPQIIERCRNEGYSLIIPDPIYKILGGRNENSAGEMAEFLNHLDAMCIETGSAIVFGHHFAKGNAAGKEQIDRASGSGVFARHPDGIITLTKHEEDFAFVVEATLRNLPPVPAFGVRWEYPVMLVDDEIDPKKLKQVGGRPIKHTVSDVVSLLDSPMTTAKWKAKALEEAGIKRSTFYELVAKAKVSQEVDQDAAGLWARRAIQTPATSENLDH